MVHAENTGNISKTNQKIEEFRRKHSDMEDELKRRLAMMKIKNLRMFLKQLD